MNAEAMRAGKARADAARHVREAQQVEAFTAWVAAEAASHRMRDATRELYGAHSLEYDAARTQHIDVWHRKPETPPDSSRAWEARRNASSWAGAPDFGIPTHNTRRPQ